jgi:xanthine dehydrogenase accessory factor
VREPLRVLFLGGGDLGTGAAHRLQQAGAVVAVVELPRPLAIRRRVAFAEALRAGAVTVQGVRAESCTLDDLRIRSPVAGVVRVTAAGAEAALEAFLPAALVDARLTKRPLEPGFRRAGLFCVALGPGHEAGRDCDAAVETLRGPDLGRVIWRGAAAPDTGVPGDVGGATESRVLRAPAAGRFSARVAIGDRVAMGVTVGEVEGRPIVAGIGGLVRGLLRDGDPVAAGQKLGDIDPRLDAPAADLLTDKARRVGEGVLEALRGRFGPDLDPTVPPGAEPTAAGA